MGARNLDRHTHQIKHINHLWAARIEAHTRNTQQHNPTKSSQNRIQTFNIPNKSKMFCKLVLLCVYHQNKTTRTVESLQYISISMCAHNTVHRYFFFFFFSSHFKAITDSPCAPHILSSSTHRKRNTKHIKKTAAKCVIRLLLNSFVCFLFHFASLY